MSLPGACRERPDQNGSPTTAASCRTERCADVERVEPRRDQPVDRLGKAIDETSAMLPGPRASARTPARTTGCLRRWPRAALRLGRSTLRTSSSASRRCMSSSVSGDSVTVDEFGLPAPQLRRTSNNSGLAVPTSSSGTSWRCSPSWSRKSSMDGSAQWRSSITARSAPSPPRRPGMPSTRRTTPRGWPTPRRRPGPAAARAGRATGRCPPRGAASERSCVSSLEAASSRSSERFTPVASRTTSSSGANVTDSP